MKRYTIRIRRHDVGVNGARIKEAVLARLIRQPVTYQFHSLREESSEVFRIELATDAGRARLLELLRGLEGDLAIAVEGLEWGWATAEERTAASGPNVQAPAGQPFTAADPLSKGWRQEGETHEYGYERKRWLRMLSGVLAIGALVALVDIRASQREPSTWGEFLIVGLWLVTIPSLVSLRSTWSSIRRIRCDSTGIAVVPWLSRKGRRLAWADVQCLEVAYDHARIRSSHGSLRVPTESMREKELLLATIRDRAGLRLVEGPGLAYTLYKRPEAE